MAYWHLESKHLRKMYSAPLRGAALLSVLLLLLSAFVGFAVYRHLDLFVVNINVKLAFICVFFALEALLCETFCIGGKNLALLLYRQRRNPDNDKVNVGDFFYPFGDKKKRAHTRRILKARIKAFFRILLLFCVPTGLFWLFEVRFETVAVAIFVFIGAISMFQGKSLEWFFELDSDENEIAADKLSSYAMPGHERESAKLAFKKLRLFLLSLLLPGIGTVIFYLPYAWSLDAVRAECIAAELVKPKN